MREHTPGPWEVDGAKVWARTGGSPFLVARTIHPTADHVGPITAGMEANARLIAAAPELLEACEGMLQLEATIREHFGHRYPADLDANCRRARAAIAKVARVSL